MWSCCFFEISSKPTHIFYINIVCMFNNKTYLFQEDIISIWNKTSYDQGATNRIRDTLRRVLNLPPNTILEYKTHNESIKSVSSVYKM